MSCGLCSVRSPCPREQGKQKCLWAPLSLPSWTFLSCLHINVDATLNPILSHPLPSHYPIHSYGSKHPYKLTTPKSGRVHRSPCASCRPDKANSTSQGHFTANRPRLRLTITQSSSGVPHLGQQQCHSPRHQARIPPSLCHLAQLARSPAILLPLHLFCSSSSPQSPPQSATLLSVSGATVRASLKSFCLKSFLLCCYSKISVRCSHDCVVPLP